MSAIFFCLIDMLLIKKYGHFEICFMSGQTADYNERVFLIVEGTTVFYNCFRPFL